MLSDKDKLDDDLQKLLKIFFEVVQLSVPEFSSGEKWKGFAHALIFKFYRHVYSLSRLFSPEVDLITGDQYIDLASIKVIERAMFENFLVFFHLYANKDDAVGKMNFDLWMCCGLMARQRFDAQTMEYAGQTEVERVKIEELWNSLKGSSLYFDTYSNTERKRLEGGEWSGVHKMASLAKNANVQYYYKKMYKHTSGFTHTGYLGALQVNQARSLTVQNELSLASLAMTLVISTHFLAVLAGMSTTVRSALDLHPIAKELFSAWYIQDSDWQRVFNP